MLRFLIVFTPLYITIFWAVVLLTNPFRSNKPRFWLGLFMLIVAVLYGCHATFFLGYRDIYLGVDWLYLFAGLSVYPMYYLYVRLLTCDSHPSYWYLLHFLPAGILMVLLLGLTLVSNPNARIDYFNSVLLSNRWPVSSVALDTKLMAFVFFCSRIVFGVQVFLYLALGYRLIRKHEQQAADFYSNLEGRELFWIKLLGLSFFFTSLISSVANVLGRGQFLDNLQLLIVPSFLFSMLFFVIGLQGNKQNQVLIEVEDSLECTDFAETDTADSRTEGLKRELIGLLEKEKLYLNPDIRVTDLCRQLRTNRTYLSRLINEEFDLNFNDFINRYRVNHAIQLFKDDPRERYTTAHIAEQAGFGSISSLNRAFKKEIGAAPGTHRKRIRGKLTDSEGIRVISD